MRVAAKVTKMMATLLDMHGDDTSNALIGHVRYSMLWPHSPPIKAIIIAQSPYPNDAIIPLIGSPFASLSERATPSITVLANSVCSVTGGDWDTTHKRVSDLLSKSYLRLDHGILLLNARVRGGYLSVKAFRECVAQVDCVMEILSGSDSGIVEEVTVLSLGLEAEVMASMLKSSLNPVHDCVRLSVFKSSHPAKIAREL